MERHPSFLPGPDSEVSGTEKKADTKKQQPCKWIFFKHVVENMRFFFKDLLELKAVCC